MDSDHVPELRGAVRLRGAGRRPDMVPLPGVLSVSGDIEDGMSVEDLIILLFAGCMAVVGAVLILMGVMKI